MKKNRFFKIKPTQKSGSLSKRRTKRLGNLASAIRQALQPRPMKSLIAAGLLGVSPTAAFAVPSVTSQTPTVNVLTALTTDNVVVNFSEAIKADSVTSSSFIVTGSLSGAHNDTPTVSGSTVTLNPKGLEPGETVTVTLTTGIQNTSDESLAAPQTWQFTVQTPTTSPGNFLDSSQSLGSSNSKSVTLGDVDGDGDLDAFVANYNQANRVWLNDGSGTFTDSSQSLGSSESASVTLGDVDGDGDLDAFVANAGQANRVWLNDGSGTFTDSSQSLGNSKSRSVTLGDVDGDGDFDAFVANSQANRVWLNDGSGTFTDSSQSLGSSNSTSVTLGDVDGDGDLDAFVANIGQANRVWLNDTYVAKSSNIVATCEKEGDNGFIVTGSFSGPINATPTTNGSVVTFNPTSDFKEGETITITLTTAITATEGAAAPQTWQFTVKRCEPRKAEGK